MTEINYDKLSNAQLTEQMKLARAGIRRQGEQRDARKMAQIEAEWAAKVEALGADTPEQQLNDEPVLGSWDESMLVPEHRGDRSGNQLLQRVTEFVNSNSSDPDIAQFLPVDQTIFEEQSADYPDFTLIGKMERKKWRIAAVNERDDSQSFKFILGNDYDRESAIEAASRELEKHVGPKFRDLSETDSILIQRTAIIDRNEAMLLYLRARLPIPWAQELERLIAQSELRGNASKVLEYVSQPRIHPILEESIEACWACVDRRGRPQFNDLLFHRGEPRFFAFDLLMADGHDLRVEKLTDRKQELRRLMSKAPRIYVDHLHEHGTALFQRVCDMDLEGIVAKHAYGPYVTEAQRTTWFKIKNLGYSQMAGREELFNRERHREPVAGWHACDLACAEVNA
jgi:hypothetical protein